MSDFKRAVPQSETGATKASARLPGLNIEIVHHQSPDGDSEQILISLQAVPSFEAFGRFLEAANPFAFWVQAGQLACVPWLEAVRAAIQPFSSAPALPTPRSDAVSRFSPNGIHHSSAIAALGHCAAAPARARVIVSHTREGVAGMSM